jgi:hypothetical protein
MTIDLPEILPDRLHERFASNQLPLANRARPGAERFTAERSRYRATAAATNH